MLYLVRAPTRHLISRYNKNNPPCRSKIFPKARGLENLSATKGRESALVYFFFQPHTYNVDLHTQLITKKNV